MLNPSGLSRRSSTSAQLDSPGREKSKKRLPPFPSSIFIGNGSRSAINSSNILRGGRVSGNNYDLFVFRRAWPFAMTEGERGGARRREESARLLDRSGEIGRKNERLRRQFIIRCHFILFTNRSHRLSRQKDIKVISVHPPPRLAIAAVAAGSRRVAALIASGIPGASVGTPT